MSEEECVGMKIRKILNEQKKKEKAEKKTTFITNVKVVMNGKLCMCNSRTNLESNFYYFYHLFYPWILHFYKHIYIKFSNCFRNVLCILSRILLIFILYCFVFFAIILLICIVVNLLHVFRNIVNLFHILFSRSVSVNVNVDKDITHTVRLQSNTTSFEMWIIFPATFLFLLVWYKQKSDKKVIFFFFSGNLWLFCFLKTKILQISLIKRELVPDQNLLCLSSWTYVTILNFRLLE